MAEIEEGRNVGRDLYETLADDDKAVIAFGMTPKHLVDMFDDLVREKIAKAGLKHYEIPETADNLDKFKKAVKPEVMAEFSRGFVLGLMDSAQKAGKLRV